MEGIEDDPHVFKSPLSEMKKDIVIPNVPYTTFIFECIRKNLKILGDRAVLVDTVGNQSLMFKDVEPIAIRFASALTKLGFKKGDIFFYATYNAALLYGLHFGVWLCGGAVRGCFQREDADEMERMLKETRSRFILCDPETSNIVKVASGQLGWPVNYFSIDGEVEGASPVEKMALEDDGSAYNKDVIINPEEDILFIPNTNGSTGAPKGALHTHRNMVTMGACVGAPMDLEKENLQGVTSLSVIGNFNVGPFLLLLNSFIYGNTFINISKFDLDNLFKIFEHYKPEELLIFPYLANIISNSPELKTRNLSFIKRISLGGSVADTSTLENLSKHFPQAKIDTMYGMTETLLISSNAFGVHYKFLRDPENDDFCRAKVLKVDNEFYVSCGPLLPLVEAKVLDVENGSPLGRGCKGRIKVRNPYMMKGYLQYHSKQGNQSSMDENGWLDTGDFGFITEDGHVYIIDRQKLIFKYLMHMISPADIERVIQWHPSVQNVGVVGVPDPETTSATWAYVVIKPGCSATEEEIKKHVADNTPFYKHLHGGVMFTDKLPEARGGKIDRSALLNQAMKEMKKSS